MTIVISFSFNPGSERIDPLCCLGEPDLRLLLNDILSLGDQDAQESEDSLGNGPTYKDTVDFSKCQNPLGGVFSISTQWVACRCGLTTHSLRSKTEM
jgi:hypothetical protein